MSLLTRRMDTTEDFSSRPANYVRGLSSTSGEGEPGGGYNFTTRRKTRRKTITLVDPSKDPAAAQSMSESTFTSPPPFKPTPTLSKSNPVPSKSKLPPIQTSLLSVSSISDMVPDENQAQVSPRRTSNRLSTSSPTKRSGALVQTHSGSSTPGGSRKPKYNPAVYAEEGVALNKVYGRGIPRTLTLPAHLTDSLMKMRIGAGKDGTSVESFLVDGTMGDDGIGNGSEMVLESEGAGVGPGLVVPQSYRATVNEPTAGDEEVMDVDMAPASRIQVPARQFLNLQTKLTISTDLRASPDPELPPPPSPRKKKRRARSLPPGTGSNPGSPSKPSSPVKQSSPIKATASHAPMALVDRISGHGTTGRGEEEDGCDADDEGGGGNGGEMISPLDPSEQTEGRGSMDISRGGSPRLRRSARRVKPKNLLDRISGMHGIALGGGEAEPEDEMASERFPRKRARTREGSFGVEWEDRAVKKIRRG